MSGLEEFSEHRPRLFAIAYRMLGSVNDAEDILQEAYLRWMRVAPAEVGSAQAYLTSIVTRLCIDQLRSARARREQYVGPWLPEPVLSGGDPEDLADSLSTAFLVLLESLSPLERAVFLLHDVFGYRFEEISTIVDKSVVRCRQLASHARRYIAARRPRFRVRAERGESIAAEFLAACRSGDLDGVMALLADDAVSISDGGGKVPAALRPIVGSRNVARFLIGIQRKAPSGVEFTFATINGHPGLMTCLDGRLLTVTWLEVVDGRIRHVYLMRNPDKLRHVQFAPADD